MAKTPEGAVKDAIKDILIRNGCWHHMPVLNGMGKDTVDFHGARRVDGRAFIIEAKAPGQKPTGRQIKRLREAMVQNVTPFVLDGDPEDLKLFEWWLQEPNSYKASRAAHLIHKWLVDKGVLDA